LLNRIGDLNENNRQCRESVLESGRSERDQRAAETWDPQQHRFEVKIAIERVLRERRRRASEFPDATAGVVAVKETA
jgi:hypothetical protein